MKTSFDIALVCNSFTKSFEGVSFDDLICIAHDLIGLNSFRNSFTKQEYKTFKEKALKYVVSLEHKQPEVSFNVLETVLKMNGIE